MVSCGSPFDDESWLWRRRVWNAVLAPGCCRTRLQCVPRASVNQADTASAEAAEGVSAPPPGDCAAAPDGCWLAAIAGTACGVSSKAVDEQSSFAAGSTVMIAVLEDR